LRSLCTDDDAVEVAAVIRMDNLSSKDIFTHVSTVKHRDVGEAGAPSSIAKRYCPVRSEKLNFWRLKRSERRASNDDFAFISLRQPDL
jgi:hypothetical protein